MTVEAFAPAKINLTLHVTGRRADGLHLLDSLVIFADIGDRLRLTAAAETSLTVTGPQAAGVPAGAGNLAMRAARAMGGPPAAISLEKHLPPASGIGGGSSDAAAVLRGLAALGGGPLPDGAALAGLGADLPVCLAARPARMRGVGERLGPVPELPDLHLVLANPGVEVPTAAVFARLAQADNPPMPETLPRWPDTAALARWLAARRNDLQPPACELAPRIGDVRVALAAMAGCLLARMSGSGATCFGLFAKAGAAADAAARLARAEPGWWVAAAKPWQGPAVRPVS